MATTLTHPSLGEVHGKSGDKVAQFFGIKYASIKDIFAPSEVVKASDGKIDATKLGPMVPGPMEKAWEDEFKFIQKSLPMPPMTMSELDGLNLNVTVPLNEEGKLPSADTKLPVFVYRVGIPGFLTSAELREAGYLGNNGIRDQANAFTWVHEYISGFGGDPENVTFIGESAGSASGFLLLHQKKPLFNRFISMSGNTLMMRPLPPPLSEFVYSTIMQSLGLGALSGADRVKALLKVPIEKIIEAGASGLPVLPVQDNDAVPCAPTFSQIGSKAEDPSLSMPGRSWCKELLIGDCQFDGSILSHMLGPRTIGIGKTFSESIEKTLAAQPGAAEKLRHTYKITPDLEDRIALRNVLQFATDIGFFATGVTWARGWPGKAWMYHFNEPNPWEGEWKGESGHVLDVAYLFQNYEEHLTQAQKSVSKQFLEDFISFMNGKTRWPAFGDGQEGAMTYGPSGDQKCWEYVEGITSEKSGRKNTIFALAESIGIEELSAAWGNFLSGN
ncbi:related to carboxylesterase [Phialocephala subalpina]|uniref:Related to carboxylesterase n=1 Tax=Phialocephala subalpina TaxID=576137 RepID=A0A1L7WG94_9HELO|nr:related to carboxylesterase [Phialocephala subalpina]